MKEHSGLLLRGWMAASPTRGISGDACRGRRLYPCCRNSWRRSVSDTPTRRFASIPDRKASIGLPLPNSFAPPRSRAPGLLASSLKYGRELARAAMAQHTMSAASGDSASPSKQMAVTPAGAEALLLMPSSLHPVAQAVKPPAKTGDDLIDQDAMAKHRQKVIIVHGVMSDDAHVGALYDCLLSRLEARRACLCTDGGERFSAGKTARTVDRSWRFDVLVEVSDIPARTLAAAQEADEANMVDLITFWTQLPPQMPLPEDCRIKMVLKSVLIRVAKLYKDRLHNFFASKLINADSGKSIGVRVCTR